MVQNNSEFTIIVILNWWRLWRSIGYCGADFRPSLVFIQARCIPKIIITLMDKRQIQTNRYMWRHLTVNRMNIFFFRWRSYSWWLRENYSTAKNRSAIGHCKWRSILGQQSCWSVDWLHSDYWWRSLDDSYFTRLFRKQAVVRPNRQIYIHL